MAENSKIEWTKHTMNPWRGCTKVSAGCANCYAETLAGRNPGTLGVWGPQGTRVIASEAMWKEPVKWNRLAAAAGERHRVFCASMADVFEDWPGQLKTASGADAGTMAEARERLFRLIDATPHLDWLLLTKRPENIAKMMPPAPEVGNNYHVSGMNVYRHNVWLGTSVENRKTTERIDVLREIPAAIRFLSLEPLLENLGKLDLTGIHWAIIGGESGPDARPFDVAWARSIIGQCRKAGTAPFMKQFGLNVIDRNDAGFDATSWTHAEGPDEGNPVDSKAWPEPLKVEHDLDGTRDGYQGAPVRVHLKDKKGGQPQEWPFDLRVREFPK